MLALKALLSKGEDSFKKNSFSKVLKTISISGFKLLENNFKSKKSIKSFVVLRAIYLKLNKIKFRLNLK